MRPIRLPRDVFTQNEVSDSALVLTGYKSKYPDIITHRMGLNTRWHNKQRAALITDHYLLDFLDVYLRCH